MNIKDIGVNLTEEEIEDVERTVWEFTDKRPTIDQKINEVTVTENNIHIVYDSPIDRIRRITGYLSVLSRFSDAKKQEVENREANPNVHDQDLDDLRYNFR
jgi:hypothetical protein